MKSEEVWVPEITSILHSDPSSVLKRIGWDDETCKLYVVPVAREKGDVTPFNLYPILLLPFTVVVEALGRHSAGGGGGGEDSEGGSEGDGENGGGGGGGNDGEGGGNDGEGGGGAKPIPYVWYFLLDAEASSTVAANVSPMKTTHRPRPEPCSHHYYLGCCHA